MKTDHVAFVLGMYETGLAVGRSLGRNGIRVVGIDYRKDIGFLSKYIEGQICPNPIEEEKNFLKFLVAFGKKQKKEPILFITADHFLIPISKNRDYIQKHFLVNLPGEKIVYSVSNKFKQ